MVVQDEVAAKWSDQYLNQQLGNAKKLCTVADQKQHFMYYHRRSKVREGSKPMCERGGD